MTVKDNLAKIKQEIKEAAARVNRDPSEITLLAVTKYVTIERTKEALAAGIKHLGENRMEGLQEKQAAIGDEAIWHFIGSLQSRKVKDVINDIDYLHALDRLSLAKEINKRAEKPINCFVQVNVSGEASKHGLHPEETAAFVKQLAAYENIHVTGLMTMAPHSDDETVLRGCFQRLHQLRDDIQKLGLDYAPCEHLSMGMSNDYVIAVEEGATHIRIGSKLVGPY